MPTFALNFSRPGAQVVAQYYNFLRLGFDGYRRVQGYARDVATRLSARIAELGPFELLTRGDELPVFAFTLQDEIDNFTVFDVSNALRERGWQVPAYTFPENRDGPRGAAGRRPARLHPRPGRPARRRPEAPAAAPAETAGPVHDSAAPAPPLGASRGSLTACGRIRETPPGGRPRRAGRPGPSRRTSPSAGRTADERMVVAGHRKHASRLWRAARHRRLVGSAPAVVVDRRPLRDRLGLLPGRPVPGVRRSSSARASTGWCSSSARSSSPSAAALQCLETFNADREPGRRPAAHSGSSRSSRAGSTGGAASSSSSGRCSSTSTRSARCRRGSTTRRTTGWSGRPTPSARACFLVSGYLAYVEVCGGSACWRRRTLEWKIAAVNLLGCVAFGISAIAAYVVPSTGQRRRPRGRERVHRVRRPLLPRRRRAPAARSRSGARRGRSVIPCGKEIGELRR